MTSRERLRTAIGHNEADRIPFDLGSRSSAIEEQAYNDLKKHLHIDKMTRNFLRAHAEIDDEIIESFGIDTKWIRSVPQSSWHWEGGDHLYIDRWNVPWRKNAGSLYYELDNSPLAKHGIQELAAVEFEELITDEMMLDMTSQAKNLYKNTQYALCSDVIGAGIIERAWYLRGFEQTFMDIMLEKKAIHRFFEKILAHQITAYKKILESIHHYIEAVWITDDVATQESLMTSPEIYREMIKPYQKRLIEFIQSYDVDVIFHSCGAIRELIPDFLDIGVRILHPIQISAKGINTKELKKEYGNDIVFWGGGCDIDILQHGTPKDVREETELRISHLSQGGGFVFTPTHCIQPGTPPENILAMVDSLRRYGNYQ